MGRVRHDPIRPLSEEALARAISNGLLAMVSTAVALGVAEAILVWTPLGDPYGWGKVPTIPERVAKLEEKGPGEWRILGLGDSFAAFRDIDVANFLRIATWEATSSPTSSRRWSGPCRPVPRPPDRSPPGRSSSRERSANARLS